MADGTYVVRVGDEAGNVDETYFKVGSTQPPAGPKVIFKNGATLVEEVASVDGEIVLTATVPTFAEAEGTDYAATTFTFVEWVKADGTAIAEGDAITEDLTVYPKYDTGLIHGNVNNSGLSKNKIDGTDRAAVHQKVAYKEDIAMVGKLVSSLSTDIMGNVNNSGLSKNKIDGTDRAAIHQKVAYKEDIAMVNQKIYVINDEN